MDNKYYLKNLNGIKIFFALLIVMFHYMVVFDAHIVGITKFIYDYANMGVVGNDAFFILSGCLITYKYYDLITTGKISGSRFLKKRLKNLFPAYFYL